MNEIIRQYRKEKNLTQGELARELNEKFGGSYTTALVSYAEKGTVDLPQNVIEYIGSNIAEKPFRNRFDARKDLEWVITSFKPQNELKSAISRDVYAKLKTCKKEMPLIAKDYAEVLGVTEAAVRAAIREIRLCGIRVVSTVSNHGYWLEENGGDYKVMRKELVSRALRIFEVIKAMDEGCDGQLTWEEERGSTAEYGTTSENCLQ